MIGDIRRVTAGDGGESALIMGSEKTAVYDTGMAYCGEGLVENIKRELDGRTLDYVLLSHTHYDHIGGLPYLRKEWPNLIVYGSAYGKTILEKPKVLALIHRLSQNAAETYLKEDAKPLDYNDEHMRIDIAVGDGDIISLGNRYFRVYETKGHTNCSLTYFMEQESILFASESTGVMADGKTMGSSILSSYKDAIASIEKCRALGAKYIFSPHSLQVDDDIAANYWDMALETAEELKEFVLKCMDEKLSEEEILQRSIERFWKGAAKEQYPQEAFLTNIKAKINVIRREFGGMK